MHVGEMDYQVEKVFSFFSSPHHLLCIRIINSAIVIQKPILQSLPKVRRRSPN